METEQAKIRILDNGLKVVLEKGSMPSENTIIHVAIYNNKYYLEDKYICDYDYDLTGKYLYDYIESFRYIPEDEIDLSVNFIELWYKVINGEFIEMKRKETSYSDVYIRKKLSSTPFLDLCVGEAEELYEDDEVITVHLPSAPL